jgi:hypothetical protein
VAWAPSPASSETHSQARYERNDLPTSSSFLTYPQQAHIILGAFLRPSERFEFPI